MPCYRRLVETGCTCPKRNPGDFSSSYPFPIHHRFPSPHRRRQVPSVDPDHPLLPRFLVVSVPRRRRHRNGLRHASLRTAASLVLASFSGGNPQPPSTKLRRLDSWDEYLQCWTERSGSGCFA